MHFQANSKLFCCALGLLILSSCNLLNERQDDTLLARAYNSRLYLEDLGDVFFPGISAEDSMAILRRHVDRWVQQQVLVYHALRTTPEEKRDFDKLLEEYRNSLLIFAFENQLAKTEMDSLVTQSEVEAFYEANKQHFILKENVVRVNYVKLPLNAPEIASVRSLYRSSGEEEMMRLENYALEHAASYFLGLDQWMLLDDILIDMPLEVANQNQWLRNNRFLETNDDYYRYFLYIADYRLKGDVSPLNLEEESIRTLILSSRKKDFLANKRRELYNQAIESSKVEKYF